MRCAAAESDLESGAASEAQLDRPAMLLPVAEQAALASDWARACVLRLRLCTCAGCCAAAAQHAAACHVLADELLASARQAESAEEAESGPGAAHGAVADAGKSAASVLLAQVQIFLMLHVDDGASKARMAAAGQWLAQWDALDKANLTCHISGPEAQLVHVLRQWHSSTSADFMLAEALAGKSIDDSLCLTDAVADSMVLSADDTDSEADAAQTLDPKTAAARRAGTGSKGGAAATSQAGKLASQKGRTQAATALKRVTSPPFVSAMGEALAAAPNAAPRLRSMCSQVVTSTRDRVALVQRLKVRSHSDP